MSKSNQEIVEPGQAHVIVVEDNADSLLAIMKLLRLSGVERLNWRTTGAQVVEFVQDMAPEQGAPDLILLDIGLPAENGFEVFARLRADPHLQRARVVAVTMHTDPEVVDQARRAGFDGFIGKPINPHLFSDQIRQILAGEQVWEP